MPLFKRDASDTIRENLDNTTSAPIKVTYQFFLDVNGCENMQEVTVIVNPRLLPSITITGNLTVCAGESVTLNSVITNGGTAPTRQWIVNGTPTSATGSTFTFIPEDGDEVTCMLTSNALCATPTSVTSSEVTITVVDYPLAPIILNNDTLNAYRGMPVDLSQAVDMNPDYTYTFYENFDGTGKINGSVVTYNPPKDDYYVTASNGACEGPMSKIILKDPCPKSTEDIEGHIYKVTSLAGLCWTENLRSKRYTCSNEEILFAKVYTCTGCPEQLDTTYGLLYDWYSAVATDPANCICPLGFHLPSKEEWSLLEKYPASQLRSTDYWLDPPGHGTDNYGFDARPAGWYNGATDRFEHLYGFTGWWASDDVPGTSTAKYFSISYYCGQILQEVKTKENGLSVRCVMKFE
jgi:uncharacterized protein (TIGR02145 family)